MNNVVNMNAPQLAIDMKIIAEAASEAEEELNMVYGAVETVLSLAHRGEGAPDHPPDHEQIIRFLELLRVHLDAARAALQGVQGRLSAMA